MDNHNCEDILFFDIAKAFDSVPHDILMMKLYKLSISNSLVSWIKDYLRNRQQRVTLGNESSSSLDIYSGVPQGSVIGPLLFLIFINDIGLHTNIKSNINIFADDSKIHGKVNSVSDIAVLEADIATLEKWSLDNCLKFNVDKCCVMHCGHNNVNHNYYIYGKILRKSVCEKDLGILVSNDMKFHEHAANQAKKANQTLSLIRRNIKYINKETFKILYGTFVRRHLEFAVQLWAHQDMKYCNKLESIQRRATKLVPSLKNLKYDERLKQLNLMSTLFRRKRGDMILMYRLLSGIENKIDLNMCHTAATTV